MLMSAYSMYDNKSLMYHPPFFSSTNAAAVRAVRDLVDDPNTTIGRHPSDYSLFLVGVWDDSNGVFTPMRPLTHVVDAVALVSASVDATPLFRKEAS